MAGKIYLGNSTISKMYLGQNEVSKVYLGQDLVYEKQASGFNVTYSAKGSVSKGDDTEAYLYFNGTTTQYWRMTDEFSTAYNAKVYDENDNEVPVGSVRQNVTSIRYESNDISSYWNYSGTSTKLPTTDTALTGDINVTGHVCTID